MTQVVLMYHDIGCESGFQNSTAMKYKVSPESFESQVKAIDAWMRDNKVEPNRIVFTFDDGGNSFLSLAAPILERYGYRGLFFIATRYIGTPGFITSEQIIELVRRGHKIGPHSHTHPERMSALPDSEIEKEWQESQKILAKIIGKKATVASVPNGYSSAKVLKAMHNAGIVEIYTSEPISKIRKTDNYAMYGRYAITDTDTAETVLSLISSSSKRFKLSARFALLGLAKTIMGPLYLVIRRFIIK